MFPELPDSDYDRSKIPSEAITSSPPVVHLSPVRTHLLSVYESEVLDFVTHRLELGVAEELIVEQLLGHSFTRKEASRLVSDLADDESIRITPATQLYEKELLDFVNGQLRGGSPVDEVVGSLLNHDISEAEARRLVDALVADPELPNRTKEAVAAEINLAFRSLAIGAFSCLLGAFLLAVQIFGGVFLGRSLPFGISLIIFGLWLFASGLGRIDAAKSRRLFVEPIAKREQDT